MKLVVFTALYLLIIEIALASKGSKNAQLFEDAVVKIDVTQQTVLVTFGTGFFVSNDGILVTNYHVIKDSFIPGFRLSIKTKSGQEISNYKVLGCSDERQIDLCALKLEFKPKAYFKVTTTPIAKGEDIFVWGHPRGYDYSLSTGIVSGLHSQNGSSFGMLENKASKNAIETVQISAPISPGNSGGPVFDENGYETS